MDNLGVLTTGAGVGTDFTRNYVHQFIQIGDGVAAPNIEGIVVTIGGDVKQRINFSGNTEIMEIVSQIIARETGGVNPGGGDLGYIIPLGDGFNDKDNLLLTIINGAAATPAVRAWSKQKGNRKYVNSGMQNIDANSSRVYTNFDYLIFDDANFDYCDIVFGDGHSEGGMDETALVGLLLSAGALFNGVNALTSIAIDNTNDWIRAITLYATGGGNMTVANITSP